MGVVRKILIFFVLTAGIIAVGKLAPRLLPASHPSPPVPNARLVADSLRDSTNALPEMEADTTGGRWHEKLFEPLQRAFDLSAKSIKQKKGFWEVVFPKGKPIHEYALAIETICRAQGIIVEEGVELRPANRSVEYLLQSNGQRIKLRGSLGSAFMAGSAKLAIIFTELDSLREMQLAALEAAPWEKSLVVNPYSPNPLLRKLRFTQARNEILIDLPMEPSAYPYVDPGKHALFIHHGKDDVARILDEDLDSLPHAAGFASRYGDRAIENLPLLEKFFQYALPKHLAFLDLTGSPRSLARQAAAAQGARSRSFTAFRDSAHIEEELARKAALAQKTGEAVLVLPYTASGFRILDKSLEANAVRFNAMGLELVTFSALVSAPDTLATGAATPSAPASPSTLSAPAPSMLPSKSGTVAKPGKKPIPEPHKAPAKATAKDPAKTPVKSAPKTLPQAGKKASAQGKAVQPARDSGHGRSPKPAAKHPAPSR
jgi:polysaccharide deacetylase 2 family uncharacterized protein YibQ